MDTTPQWDTIIIGGGPAGLSAALMLGRARRRVLVIDAGEPRNRFASHMHGLLGSDGMDPAELLARGRAELDRYGVTIHAGTVTDVTEAGDGLRVATHQATHAATHLARTAVLATGLTDVLPNILGLAQRWGNTVLHCPYCHGWEVRDGRLGVLVRDPRHLHLAQLVRQWSARLTVIATNPEHVDAEARERLEARGARILTGPVARIEGDAPGIDAVVMADGTRVEIDALFAPGDPRLHDTPVAGLGLESVDGPWGATLAVDATGRTSHPRLWVAGNVTDLAATVTASLAAGAAAGAAINAALVSLDADSARASAYWEERYAEGDRMWSGRPNATLVEVVRGLAEGDATAPGAALDLGCGEGADVAWLSSQGWDATGVDISPTAIARGQGALREHGVDHARLIVADLETWEPPRRYDLVTASFLHSPVALARTTVLRRAASAVAPGGHLLLITHAAPPPWASPEHVAHHRFVTAREELDALALAGDEWDEVAVEHRERDAHGPDGTPGRLEDGVILLRRR